MNEPKTDLNKTPYSISLGLRMRIQIYQPLQQQLLLSTDFTNTIL